MCASSLVTLTAVLGGIGVLPTGGQDASAVASALSVPSTAKDGAGAAQGSTTHDDIRNGATRDSTSQDRANGSSSTGSRQPKQVAATAVIAIDTEVAPAQSGAGRRVVFSQDEQRVWLVDDDNDVERTYLVSGSVYDNLDPGTYAVFSRSEQAWGIDDSGTMNWFVRFAHGPNAAIGFHDIPVDDGEQVQTAAELGSPQSHGCIRQRTADAMALWDFAPIGTTVVVI